MLSTWGVGCGKKLTSVDVDIDEDVYGEREWVNAKDVMSIKEKMKSLPKWSEAHKLCYRLLRILFFYPVLYLQSFYSFEFLYVVSNKNQFF